MRWTRRAASAAAAGNGGPGTRLRLRTEVLAGTWEALVSGQADLAIGVGAAQPAAGRGECEPLGEMGFVFAVAPHHPLAAATRADRRRRAAAPPRGGGGRLGPAPVAADREPAARAGRADGVEHGGQDRGAAARPGLRLRARADGARSTSKPATLVQQETLRPNAAGAHGLRLALRQRAGASARRWAWRCNGGWSSWQPDHAPGAAGAPRAA